MSKRLLWIALILMVMVHVQMNYHSSLYFVLASIFCGAIPLLKMNWVKYWLLGLVSVMICFVLQNPGSQVFKETIASIVQMPYYAFVAITFVVSSLLFSVLAYLSYIFIAKPFIFDFFGIALADEE